MGKKTDIGIAFMLLLLIGGALIGYLVLNGDVDKIQDLQTQKDININREEKLDTYIGYWYETKDKAGLNSLVIKDVEFNTLKIDLTFYNIKEFKNLSCEISDDVCEFAYSEGEDSLKGKVMLYDNEIVLSILESTYEHIDIDTTYMFSYFLKEAYAPSEEVVKKYTGERIDQKYLGTWYLSYISDYSKDKFIIAGADGREISIYLTLKGHEFKSSIVVIENSKGEVIFTERDTDKKIKGVISLEEKIVINITESEIDDIKVDSYNFEVKPKEVDYKYYVARWYIEEEKDDENYFELKYDENNELMFDLMIKRRAQLKNVVIKFSKNIGSFDCKSASDERYLKGYITFDDDRVYVYFYDSTVSSISSGTSFEYAYKGVE